MNAFASLLSKSIATQQVLIVAAHPDDETIGAGILLSRLPFSRVLHVTDGAPRDRRFFPAFFAGHRAEYAAERRRELVAAVALAGVKKDSLDSLDIPDLEATLSLALLSRRIAARLAELRPEIVVTHAYEGGHPDHDATAFAVHMAAAMLHRKGLPSPAILEMALYHAQPRATNPRDLVVGSFLPNPDSAEAPVVIELGPAERALKECMLTCFASQRAFLRKLPRQAWESFRPAPTYDFTRPPHPGPLLYELAGFPITGDHWREVAEEAVRELGFNIEAQP